MKKKEGITGIAINNIDSIISNFNYRYQKRIIRYLIRTLRKKRRELR